MNRLLGSLLGCLALAPFAGCNQTPSAPPAAMQMPPPEVSVSQAVTREVTDYEEFPGRLEPVNVVELRARVTGYLDKVHFTEGALVKQGELLFEIDPRPYKTMLAQSEGNVTQMEGRWKRLEADMERARDLWARKTISREDFDKIAGDHSEATGSLNVARANRDMANLNLSWTQIRSPLSGRISRRFMDPGNLVKADETVLTTIVDLDPIYAYFDLDERTTLRLQKLMRSGKISSEFAAGAPVHLGLADEQGHHPHQGRINFTDNKVDPDTGTWRLRGLFENADHALTPGLFVRVKLPIGQPYQALLVAEQALGTDQGQKYLYVLEDPNRVVYRRVKVGRLQHGLRVITEGLTKDEKVVVSGLQRVRPGIEVQPTMVPMPGAEPDKAAEKTP